MSIDRELDELRTGNNTHIAVPLIVFQKKPVRVLFERAT